MNESKKYRFEIEIQKKNEKKENYFEISFSFISPLKAKRKIK